MLTKTIEWGTYLLVFLLPLQTRYIFKYGSLNGSYWEYGTISLYLTDIVLLLLLAALVWSNFRNNIVRKDLPAYWLSIASLELVAFISIFFSTDTLAALIGYARLLLGIGMFTLVFKARYNTGYLLLSFIAGALMQSYISLWQFFSQSSFANKWLGMAGHRAADLGTSVIEVAGGGRWLRAYGGFDHPNILGLYLCLALMFVIVLYRRRIYEKKGNEKFFFVFLAIFVFLLLGMCFSFSRSACLAFFFGLLLYALQTWRYHSLTDKKNYTHILIISFLILGMFVSINFSLVRTRAEVQTRLETQSVDERLAALPIAKQIFAKNKLWGVGINNYSAAYAEIQPGEKAWYYQPVHNVYALVLSELGILGLFALFLLLFTIITHNSWSSCLANPLSPVLAIMLLGFNFDHWWWSSHVGILFIFLILGLFVKISENEI